MSRPLKRGRACMNCRFLKIKCDGQKPICGPCRKHPKNDDCEYSDGPARSRTKALEDAVSRLEVRLHELEHPEVSTPSMMLHDPCASTSLPQLTIFPLHPASRSLPNLPYHPQPQLLSPSNSLLKSLSSPLSPFSPHSPTGGSPPYQSRSPLPSPRGIFDTRTVSPNPSKPNVEQIQTLLESFHAYAEDPVLKCPTVPSEENNRERSIRKPTATSCSVCLLSNDHPLWNEAVHRTGIPSTFCRLPDQHQLPPRIPLQEYSSMRACSLSWNSLHPQTLE
ncbi:hypothetical protein C8J57DRAFT_523443 [Mycena rebaudengoi]|nr:hypothetical protein C8J57DRAFT_523443 [Mycena rebaudengoi]